jgi:hypothetical protein
LRNVKSMASRTGRPKLNPIRALSDGLDYFARSLPGGVQTTIALARLSEDEAVQAVALFWNELPRKQRRNVSLDELCRDAGVGASKFLGTVVGKAYELGIDVSAVFEAIMNLDSMPKYIKRALRPGAFRDRERILRSAGLLPRSKEPTAGTSSNPVEDLPSIEEETICFTRLLRRGRR